jgi:hypothetical protein
MFTRVVHLTNRYKFMACVYSQAKCALALKRSRPIYVLMYFVPFCVSV